MSRPVAAMSAATAMWFVVVSALGLAHVTGRRVLAAWAAVTTLLLVW